MPREGVDDHAAGRVPDLDRLVPAAGGQPLAVGVEGDRVNPAVVPLELEDAVPAGGRPDLDGPGAGKGETSAVGGPGHTVDAPFSRGQRLSQPPRFRVARQFDSPLLVRAVTSPADGQRLPVGCEFQVGSVSGPRVPRPSRRRDPPGSRSPRSVPRGSPSITPPPIAMRWSSGLTGQRPEGPAGAFHLQPRVALLEIPHPELCRVRGTADAERGPAAGRQPAPVRGEGGPLDALVVPEEGHPVPVT